jgi:hypothetical protein
MSYTIPYMRVEGGQVMETTSPSREHLINDCAVSPVGRAALKCADKAGALQTPETARQELHIQLIELADAYDSMGHHLGGDGGTQLDNDCLALRKFVRQELRMDS